MRVCITGGCGFLGTNLTEWFMKNEPHTEVVLVDIASPGIPLSNNVKYVYADIRNLQSLISAFEGVDEVYNLAGVLGTAELIGISSLAVETNVLGANNVFDAVRLCKVKRVYNVAKPFFDSHHENTYTLTKHAGELLGLMYREQYGIEVATVRWLNAIGPHQHLYPVRKFVPTMIMQALYGYDLEVYGSGNQTIDPIDVRDLCRFTVVACRTLGKHPHVVDLGSGVAVSCNDAAETILDMVKGYQRKCGVVPTTSVVKHIAMREGEAADVDLVADMSYWESIGMRTEISFRQSVLDTIKYVDGLPKYHIDNALMFYGKKL